MDKICSNIDSVSQLIEQPSTLQSEINNIDDDMRNNTFFHYRSFIKVSQNLTQMDSNRVQLFSQISTLQDSLTSIQNNCSQFIEQCPVLGGENISSSRLENVSQVLRVPQLVETLVAQHAYDDVHQLICSWRKVTPLPIVQRIVESMEVSYARMISSMLSQLRHGTGRVSELLKIVTVLRKTGLLTEDELKNHFLNGRAYGVDSRVVSVNNLPLFEGISLVVELYREHVFESVTHYSAIFDESTPLLPAWIRGQLRNMMWHLKNGCTTLHNLTLLRDIINFLCSTLLRIKIDFSSQLQRYYQSLVLDYFDHYLTQFTHSFVESMGQQESISETVVQDYTQLLETEEYKEMKDYFGQVRSLLHKVDKLLVSSTLPGILCCTSKHLNTASHCLLTKDGFVRVYAFHCVPALIAEVEELFPLSADIVKLKLKASWSLRAQLKCFERCREDALSPLVTLD